MSNIKTSSFRLAAALAASLVSFAASATEADLSPPLNGGSGDMPSGYSQLNFFIGDGYWAPELRLPVAPSANDRVMADTVATFGARFRLDDTAFAMAGGIAFNSPDTLRFAWSEGARKWDLLPGGKARVLIGPNRPEDRVPASNHALTQYTMENGRHAGILHLPAWAPEHALLSVSNRAQWGTTIVADGLPFEQRACKGGQDCTFIFDGTKQQWSKLEKRDVIRPMAQLPFPSASRVNVVTRAVDVHPLEMTLPAMAVHGDVYTFLHTHPNDTYQVMPAHTSMTTALVLPEGQEVRFRFNRPMTRWEKID